MRNPEWRKRDKEGTLRLSVGDAEKLGIDNGSRVRITTQGGSAVAVAEINETMMQGHISLPNGHGLSYSPAGGEPEIFGVPTFIYNNQMFWGQDRIFFLEKEIKKLNA